MKGDHFKSRYLSKIDQILRTPYPDNRTINIVCHGHSVPSGYFKTPEVHSLESYPHLLRIELAKQYPQAVINVIVTGIGGENSEQGAMRFERDVLGHRPDVVIIDYSLNDRVIGLERSRKSWVSMIEQAGSKSVKVLLSTPTPDLGANLNDPKDPLTLHAEQVRRLAEEYHVGLVDSLSWFRKFEGEGGEMKALMSQHNHPNESGHGLVAKALMEWFHPVIP